MFLHLEYYFFISYSSVSYWISGFLFLRSFVCVLLYRVFLSLSVILDSVDLIFLIVSFHTQYFIIEFFWCLYKLLIAPILFIINYKWTPYLISCQQIFFIWILLVFLAYFKRWLTRCFIKIYIFSIKFNKSIVNFTEVKSQILNEGKSVLNNLLILQLFNIFLH